MNSTFHNSISTNRFAPDTLRKTLYEELEKFAHLLSLYKISVRIDSPQASTAWSLRSDEEKIKIIENFSQNRLMFSEMHLAGVSLRDNRAMLARSMERCKLKSRHNLLDVITNENMVEVYNLENVQLYRSINFFDYCNYSLLDLLTREWFVLYDRLPSITEAIMKSVHETLAASNMRVFDVPPHVMKERDSNPRGIFHIEHQYCCPLYSPEGELAAVAASMNVKEIDLLAAEDKKFVFLRPGQTQEI